MQMANGFWLYNFNYKISSSDNWNWDRQSMLLVNEIIVQLPTAFHLIKMLKNFQIIKFPGDILLRSNVYTKMSLF